MELPKGISPRLYNSLPLSEKLYPHLLELERTANKRIETMLLRMMVADGVTEELKGRDPMGWVQMNSNVDF